jgi:Homeodomain-like domain
MLMVNYVVRLTSEERAQLLTLVTTGRAAAVRLLHARILRKAESGAGHRRWSDAEIAAALDPSTSTVHRVRQALVDWGMAAALSRKRPTGRQYRKLDGAQEAQLLAVACRLPPAGRRRWTLQLLADKLVALEVVDTISAECVRSPLKKPRSNHGNSSRG